ncbi:hypothetical protein ECP03023084_2466 [Escherichia coli P0302308.4]|nr:hypothetical protein ECP03023081_3042 [Escherichia coli P0302308.1]END02322.1 hypothetical protein ECP030230811_2661 [Escherichia coli P0302308.11]END10097.1 hypothetical protein ECP03023083_2635 [Escherichia coli P0302308.3]END14305.1 hypothetical protein ECP03023082_2651 [Escherichia coli P0302308.2]END22225.1 hypothetical protein ECP03023085_2620 [Escherichia coli P0302308.5]END25874.1 hypothetical protein ECP03023084_2466 [Escherichia coli P0302308.4]ENH18994.1 hypothetical protein ECP
MYNNKACVNLKVELWFMQKKQMLILNENFTEIRVVNDKNYIDF